MRRLLYVIVVFGLLTVTSCNPLATMTKMAQDQQLTVNPNPLEVHGDSVNFEMSAVLPVKMLKKGKVYTLNTYYKYGNSEVELDAVAFEADKFPNADTQQPRVSEDFSFAYDPAMKTGDLEVKGVASDPRNGNTEETPRFKVADGIITTSRLVERVYFPAYADHGYNNQEELVPTNIDFYFEQGRSVLKPTLKIDTINNREKQRILSAFIADKNVTRTVTITGTHSPEGLERINSNLAKDRPAVIQNYYNRMMRRYDYKGMADSIEFIIKPVIEDWGDFRDALAAYDGISSTEKSEYLNIINGSGTFEEKEKSLQKLSTYKSKVFKDVYPGLRTAKTEILTVKDKKTDAEIAVLAKQITMDSVSADTLSLQELMYSATLTPNLQEKESIYMAATKKGGEWHAHNNLGAVYIAMGMENGDASNADKAVTQLEISLKAKESAEAYVNLGSAYLMQGNRDAALDALRKASGFGPSNEVVRGANGVIGALEVMKGDYGRAVNSLSSSDENADNLFNKGLAQILNKDYENALTTLSEALEKDSDYAMAHYASAIAHVRLQNQEKAIESVASAVAADPDLKEAAVADLEFNSLKNSPAWTNAMN